MMKRLMVTIGVITASLLLYILNQTGTAVLSPGPSDFPAFKKEKLRLPVRQDSVYLTLSGNNIPPGGEKSSAAVIRALRFEVGNSSYLLNIPEPLPECRLEKTLSFDIDNDGVSENYSLQDGVLTVNCGSKKIWQSADSWWIDDFLLGDANNDSISDLNLLVWKSGSFGSRRPFWITGEDTSIKSHFFIFNLVQGSFKPIWQSSNLDCPNYGSVLEDINGDGKNELVVSEGNYSFPGERRVTVWQWNGWGFSRIPVYVEG